MSQIKVSVIEYPDRSKYQLRWTDPRTGKLRTKSSGIKKGSKARKDQANQIAGLLAKDLNENTAQTGHRLSWDRFVEMYFEEYVSGLQKTSADKINTLINHIQNLMVVNYLQDIDSRFISSFLAKLRKKKPKPLSESSIDSNKRHLKAMLNWAKDQDLIPVAPSFPKIQRKKKTNKATPMKGRPITDAEFLKMLQAVPKVVPEDEVDGYIFFLRCLYASGLRLQEATELYWDRDDKLCLHFEDDGEMLLWIPDEYEKGHQDRLMELAPEFAELLDDVPQDQRRGPVFNLKGQWRWIGRRISKIGEAAGIVVNEKTGKFASAHDLRRAYGERWAGRVGELDLMRLMRHDSIQTTLRYYAKINAKKQSRRIRQAYETAKKEHGSDAVQIPSYRPNHPK